jgi:hypothetical protein
MIQLSSSAIALGYSTRSATAGVFAQPRPISDISHIEIPQCSTLGPDGDVLSSFRSDARDGPAVKRRDFIKLVGVAGGWALAAHAQQSALPVVAFVRDGSADANARYVAAFRKGLNEAGYVEGQNVTVEYHWLEANTIACRH